MANDTTVEDGSDAETLAELASIASRFAKPDVERVRALRRAGETFDRDVWSRLAELGWLGLAVPEKWDGAGGDEQAVAVVAEKLGSGAYPEPFVAASVLVTRLLTSIEASGGDVRSILGPVIEGTEVLALATVPERGPVGGRQLRCERDGDGVLLAGRVDWVPVGRADGFLVHAHADDGSRLVRVSRDADGVRVHERTLADGTTAAALEFDGHRVSATDVLAIGDVADRAVAEATEAALVATAAELIGLADRALTMTLEYLGTREQFGRPIGAFQVLQHRAVDMYIQLRVARATLGRTLSRRARGSGSADLRRAAAGGAYARACLAADHICRQAVQLHGAIGFTDEYDLGYYVNRMVVLTAWLGGAERHRRAYLDLVGALPADPDAGEA